MPPGKLKNLWNQQQDISFYHHDVLGSVMMLTDKYGHVTERYQYDIWGKVYDGKFADEFPGCGQSDNVYGFTGQRYQPEIGVYSFPYRDYSPRMMRWLTEDPVKDGVNWYQYCGGDPVNFIDPLGLLTMYELNHDINTEYTWPTPGTVTSVYGNRTPPNCTNGNQGSDPHKGVDIAAPIGTPVVAAADGTVTSVSEGGAGGKSITVTHSDGTQTSYSHLSKQDVTKGQNVEQGQKIGEVGDTGNVTGPHLHFGAKDEKGNPVDPMNILPAPTSDTKFKTGEVGYDPATNTYYNKDAYPNGYPDGEKSSKDKG